MLSGRQWQRDNVDPYPAEMMDGAEMPGTICGVLREIYQKSKDEEVRLLSRISTSMAKKMASKMREYHDQEKG